MLESRNLDLYFEWNQLFMDINVNKCPPTDEFIRKMKILRKRLKNLFMVDNLIFFSFSYVNYI